VEDEELARQYAGASALMMLSLDEGFGLPVLEAMAQGCPVIAAAEAALPEVIGDAGVLVHPHDPGAVADALRRIMTDVSWRDELRRRGLSRATSFSWTSTAARTRAVYELALQNTARKVCIQSAPETAPASGREPTLVPHRLPSLALRELP